MKLKNLSPAETSPASAFYMRGREAGYQFAENFSPDEMAEGIKGWKAGVEQRMKEIREKANALLAHADKATKAL